MSGDDEGTRRYGLFLGEVVDNADPERRGRVRVRVPELLEEPLPTLALPRGWMVAPGGGRFVVPEAGAKVFVQFLGGNLGLPVYEPGPFPRDEKPAPVRDDPEGEGGAYPGARFHFASDRGWYLVENANGDLELHAGPTRRWLLENPEGSTRVVAAAIDLNSDPAATSTHNAARKGDRVNVGSLKVVLTSGVVSSVTWTDPDGGEHALVTGIPQPLWGRISEGSASVRIGG